MPISKRAGAAAEACARSDAFLQADGAFRGQALTCANDSSGGGEFGELVAQLPRISGNDLVDIVMRMIFGGFNQLLGDALAAPGLINGTVLPVPAGNRKAYTAAAVKMADLFPEFGATSVVDAWGDDLPEGKVNSFHSAVMRKPDEAVVFSWINWKDQAAQDAGWEKIMADPRMAELSPATVGADLGRMIYGTFRPLVVA